MAGRSFRRYLLDQFWKVPMIRTLTLVLLLAGCADFPEVDVASRVVAGAAPALLPLEQVLMAPTPVAEARGVALAAEADALQRRVAR